MGFCLISTAGPAGPYCEHGSVTLQVGVRFVPRHCCSVIDKNKIKSMGDFSAGFLSITNGRNLLYFSYSFVNLTPSGRTAPYRSRFCFHDVGAMLPEKDMCFRSWWGPRKHIRGKVIQILRQASHNQKDSLFLVFRGLLCIWGFVFPRPFPKQSFRS